MTDGKPVKVSIPKLNTRHVHVLGVVGLLGLAGVGYALGYAPSTRARQQVELGRVAILKANDESRATGQHLETARTELAALLEGFMEKASPDGTLTDSLTDIASDHALAVHTVLASEATPVDGLMRASLNVHASGSFSDILGFLEGLRESAPGIAVDGFSIMQEPMVEGSLAFQASLSAYAPQAAPADATMPNSWVGAPATNQPDR